MSTNPVAASLIPLNQLIDENNCCASFYKMTVVAATFFGGFVSLALFSFPINFVISSVLFLMGFGLLCDEEVSITHRTQHVYHSWVPTFIPTSWSSTTYSRGYNNTTGPIGYRTGVSGPRHPVDGVTSSLTTYASSDDSFLSFFGYGTGTQATRHRVGGETSYFSTSTGGTSAQRHASGSISTSLPMGTGIPGCERHQVGR